VLVVSHILVDMVVVAARLELLVRLDLLVLVELLVLVVRVVLEAQVVRKVQAAALSWRVLLVVVLLQPVSLDLAQLRLFSSHKVECMLHLQLMVLDYLHRQAHLDLRDLYDIRFSSRAIKRMG